MRKTDGPLALWWVFRLVQNNGLETSNLTSKTLIMIGNVINLVLLNEYLKLELKTSSLASSFFFLIINVVKVHQVRTQIISQRRHFLSFLPQNETNPIEKRGFGVST